MNISWDISELDIQKIKNVLNENDNPFMKTRRHRNVQKKNVVIDKDAIIKAMIMCLLTSQQRSGPNSNVGQFLRQTPFPISEETVDKAGNLESFIRKTLSNNRLPRYINKISSFFTFNLQKIKDENWSVITDLNELIYIDSKLKEREFADKLHRDFKGFGPKQSRNFLQVLGLTKYEIPIDSRITNWLNEFGFPVALTSSSLGDKEYYHFVSDGIQELCKKAETYPCLLDAAIFSSFDNVEWTSENTIF